MKKRKVLTILGSPRKKGNSAILAKEVSKGIVEKENEVEEIYLHDKGIEACKGCDYCKKNENSCVINDYMQELYPKIIEADSIVIASPIYWFTMSAQTKLFMDRCYALFKDGAQVFKGKKIAIILTYADEDVFGSGGVNALRTFQDSFNFLKAEIVGVVHGSAWEAGAIAENETLMKKAFELGGKL